MKCFYHSADLDGHCSGAIVKHRFPECELVGFDYGQAFPWDQVEQDEMVFMVDVSLSRQEMMRLDRECRLTWIDHHQRKIDEMADLRISGFQESKFSACELTWVWCNPDRKTPRAVRLLGRYDVWDHADPEVLPFQYGMRVLDTDPARGEDAAVWDQLFLDHAPDLAEILENGRMILKYQRQQDGDAARAGAFETRIDGLSAVALNSTRRNSMAFESVYDAMRHALMISFFMRMDGEWTVSLYTTHPEVDVSALAVKRGGGGHPTAAGFQCEELPFIPEFNHGGHGGPGGLRGAEAEGISNHGIHGTHGHGE